MKAKEKVAAVRCASYDENQVERQLSRLMEAIDAAALIKPGMKVLIKPNLLSAKNPEEFTTTHPEVLRALVRYVQRHGAQVMWRTVRLAGSHWIPCVWFIRRPD